MENEKRIIEINGIKMEVDLRNAKRIDTFKVGDAVKVLDMNYQNGVIKAGVIVGFAEFQKKASIEIMVLDEGYSGIDFKFITVSSDSDSKYEIIHYNNYEKIFTKSNVIDKFNREIEKKKIEIDELERKRKYYVEDFEKAFEQIILSSSLLLLTSNIETIIVSLPSANGTPAGLKCRFSSINFPPSFFVIIAPMFIYRFFSSPSFMYVPTFTAKSYAFFVLIIISLHNIFLKS